MDDETNGTPRPAHPDPPPSGRESRPEDEGERRFPRRPWKIDEIHRQGWIAYVLGVLLLLALLLVVGRVVAGWMAHYAETAVEQPEEP